MNRRMPNGTYGGVRGGLISPYSIFASVHAILPQCSILAEYTNLAVLPRKNCKVHVRTNAALPVFAIGAKSLYLLRVRFRSLFENEI